MRMEQMNCIVCERLAIMKYRKQDIVAAFCPVHVPKAERPATRLQITLSLGRGYF